MQTVMHHILDAFTKSVNPIACHVGEELYNYRYGRDPSKDEGCESVMKAGWFHTEPQWHNPDLAKKWETIRLIRKSVYRVVQEAREVRHDGLLLAFCILAPRDLSIGFDGVFLILAPPPPPLFPHLVISL